MSRSLLGLLVTGVVAAAGVAPAAVMAQQAQYSTKDIIGTFAKKSEPVPQTPQAGECEKKGMVTGDDGVCEPVKNARGFSLPTRANVHSASAPAPAVTAVTRAPNSARTHLASTTPRAAMTAAAPAPTVKRDLLITFKLGSADLTDQAKANAKVFAEALKSPALADSKFDISGYTDASGDKDKNLTLSQARAASVKSFLVSQGVDDSRLATHGYGATEFAVPSSPTSPRNRRVEARRTD